MAEAGTISRQVHRAFFARYGGRLRPIQERAFDLLQDARDGLVMAQTGSGKTEAVLVPVAQRLISAEPPDQRQLRALVISPARALASDLHRRMAPIFAELGLRMDVATSDRRTLGKTPTDILIRTPEGLDSDLCHRAAWLSGVEDVVIDELHKFLEDARGTQLAGLLAQLSAIAPTHRRLAISATVPDVEAPARARLLRDPIIVEDPAESGSLDVIFHDWVGNTEQAAESFVRNLGEKGIRKAIGFVGRKARAETLAHLLNRGFLRGKCFPHHADLSSSDRRRIEEQLRHLPVALVVATTTLEVGIDIGSIDTCILFDAPPDRSAFLQRVGRSGRRSGRRRVICASGLYDRRIDFARVAGPVRNAGVSDCRPFLAGCLQQILSFVVQGGGQTREEVRALCWVGFGIEFDTVDALLSALAVDGWISVGQEQIEPTDQLLQLGTSPALHRTFAGSSGIPVVDEVTGKHLGRAAVVNRSDILLGGKGRRIKRIDPNTGAAISSAVAEGKAMFSASGASLFERLAGKYAPLTGGRFRT